MFGWVRPPPEEAQLIAFTSARGAFGAGFYFRGYTIRTLHTVSHTVCAFYGVANLSLRVSFFSLIDAQLYSTQMRRNAVCTSWVLDFFFSGLSG